MLTKIQQTIIASLASELETKYSSEPSGHDWFHLFRVWNLAKQLALEEHVNQFVIELSALLHDVDDFKFKKDGEDPFKNIKHYLTSYNIDSTVAEKVLSIVPNISYKGAHVPDKPMSEEGEIVRDADRLDAMGAIGIARTFTYNGFRGVPMYDPNVAPIMDASFDTYKNRHSSAINHFYEKIRLLPDRLHTKKAKQIAVKRHKFLETFLKTFFAEWEGKA
jgi:uncharacterized protein